MEEKLKILVTGGSRGIGFELVAILVKDPRYSLITFTSTTTEKAEKALSYFQKIKNPSVKINYLLLELLNKSSIDGFLESLNKDKTVFDIFVNNAGVYSWNTTDEKVVSETLQVNLKGPLLITGKLITNGLIAKKIILVSSTMGKFSVIKNPQLREELKNLLSKTATESELVKKIAQYESEIKSASAKNWSYSSYSVSKLFLSIYAKILSNKLKKMGVEVFCCCPGFCQTDMAGSLKAPRTAKDGAETILYLINGQGLSKYNGDYYQETKWASLD